MILGTSHSVCVTCIYEWGPPKTTSPQPSALILNHFSCLILSLLMLLCWLKTKKKNKKEEKKL